MELTEGNTICLFLVISLELFEQKLSIQKFGKANVKSFSEKSLIAKKLSIIKSLSSAEELISNFLNLKKTKNLDETDY